MLSFFASLFRSRNKEPKPFDPWTKEAKFIRATNDKIVHRLDKGSFFYDLATFRKDYEWHHRLDDMSQYIGFNSFELYLHVMEKRTMHRIDCPAIIHEEHERWRDFLDQSKGLIGYYKDHRSYSGNFAFYLFSSDSDAMLFKMMFG